MRILSTPLLTPERMGTGPLTVLAVGGAAEWVPLARRTFGTHPRVCLLGVVDSGAEALLLVPNLQPDVVVVDAATDDLTGFEVARLLRRTTRGGRTVVAGPGDGLHWRYLAQAAGAMGYLPKHSLDAERLLALVESHSAAA